MTDLSPETVGKLVALARHAAVSASGHSQKLALEIVAELPEPVDPDTLEAKKALAEAGWVSEHHWYSNALEACEIAIKRGRALAKDPRP